MSVVLVVQFMLRVSLGEGSLGSVSLAERESRGGASKGRASAREPGGRGAPEAMREGKKARAGTAQPSMRATQEYGGGVLEGEEVGVEVGVTVGVGVGVAVAVSLLVALPERERVTVALLLPQQLLLAEIEGEELPEPLRVGLRELEAHRLALLLTLGKAEGASVKVRLPVVSAERERERVGLLLAQRVCVPVPLTVGEPDCVPVLLLLALREAPEEALVLGEKV